MNQYGEQNQFFQQPLVVKNAAYYRQRARAALKSCYWYALLAALLAGLLGVGTENFSFEFDTDFFNELKEGTLGYGIADFLDSLIEKGVTATLQAYPVVLLAIIGAVTGMIFGLLFSFFVGGPVTLGYERYKLDVIDGGGRDIKILFRYFKQSYKKSVALRVVHSLILFGASVPLMVMTGVFGMALLKAARSNSVDGLILPAVLVVVIAWATVALQIWLHYRYRFCYMIMAEYPEIGVADALRNSAQLMKGNKWKLFCLDFSFIGWILLSILTCGIGSIFLTPYIDIATAAFYDEIANRQAARDAVFPSLNPDDYDPNGLAF